MRVHSLLPSISSAAALVCIVLTSAPANAQFVRNTANIPSGSPFNNSSTENVDFGDVDNDGDWDAIFADGGDDGDDQNRIWINQGGAQGGTLGVFLDDTAARLPVINDDSRDIEFVDLDNDGDLDIYDSNTAQITPQSNRWWINMGGLQAGSIGFYQDQTSTRWVNLGVNNGVTTFSSISAANVLGGGGFIDWSCDCDFGDLDNDGDLDLVHSTYGGAFGGKVPTRIFLNTSGLFEEFNPSGYQLTGTEIANGNPGLWAEGTQQAETINATGANCDVASSALDIDVGDIDGDLDLDILHGARTEKPRMFHNRFQENGGVLVAFRDMTGTDFPANYSFGDGHYEQEMGDLDNDNDLDIYGLNWQVGGGFTDVTLANTGNGVYGSLTTLSGSTSDDNEGDFLDYDMDGDMDLLVANFSGQERLYRNNYAGGAFSYTNVTSTLLPTDSTTSLDADCCDVDADGDTDVFVANDSFQADWYLQNTSTANDTTAARMANLEQAPNRTANAAPTVVRVQVYDNAPYYITWYNPTVLEYSVNAGAFTPVPMKSSAGQIFRGEIPGTLVGTIDYRAKSTDKYGNTGTSATKSYVATGGCTGTPTVYCTAKTNSLGCIPTIGSSGVPSATAGAGFLVTGSNVRNQKSGLLFYKANGIQQALAYQGGTLCLGPSGIKRTAAQSSGGNALPANDCSGVYSIDMNAFALSPGPPFPDPALQVQGTIVHCQWWGRDQGFPAPNNTTLTDGLEYTVCP